MLAKILLHAFRSGNLVTHDKFRCFPRKAKHKSQHARDEGEDAQDGCSFEEPPQERFFENAKLQHGTLD